MQVVLPSECCATVLFEAWAQSLVCLCVHACKLPVSVWVCLLACICVSVAASYDMLKFHKSTTIAQTGGGC